jgi:NADPH:quinone reductase-like Zn-dependent oxidoreductase
LVNGCTGGVGLFALQLAKRMGAHVTGVCSTDGVALTRDLGANEVIDYRKQSLTEPALRYHSILELSGKLSFDTANDLLDEHGVYVDFSPSPASLIGNTLANPFRSHKHLFAMTSANTADLEALARLLDDSELRAPPVKEFPLEKFREAFELAESGGLIGKVVIRTGH